MAHDITTVKSSFTEKRKKWETMDHFLQKYTENKQDKEKRAGKMRKE